VIRDAIVAAVKETGYSVAIDAPFSGALVPLSCYGKDDRISSVMIEVNGRLYMDEQSGRRSRDFNQVRAAVGRLVEVVAEAAARTQYSEWVLPSPSRHTRKNAARGCRPAEVVGSSALRGQGLAAASGSEAAGRSCFDRHTETQQWHGNPRKGPINKEIGYRIKVGIGGIVNKGPKRRHRK
jgi:hypothetical protein